MAVAVVPEPGAAKLPDGPTAGAVKVTCVPATGVPLASRTETDSGAYGLPIGVPCGELPGAVVMVAGAPELVSMNPDEPPDVVATRVNGPAVGISR